ncbi:MAG: tail needle knob protein [Aeromonadaceae bacterium]
MASKPTPVSVEARRLDISILPQNFSLPLTDYLVNQSDDLQGVANQANGAAEEAYQAQLTNEQQDEVLASHTETLQDHENRIDAAELTLQDHELRIGQLEVTVAEHTDTLQQHEDRLDLIEDVLVSHGERLNALEYAVTRKKSELVFTGLSLLIPTTPTNLITLLKAITPASGSFAPFFDIVNDKMVVFNENKTLNFKLVVVGSWASGSLNRSMSVTFSGAVPDTLTEPRYPGTTTDNCTFPTFFSVDKDGFLATNGSTITIVSNGSTFTANTVKLIAEQ